MGGSINRLTPLLLLYIHGGTIMLHEALRLVRSYHDLSQSELSVRLGISNSYLSEIESGKKQPTLEILQRYSEQFDIPLSSLLFFAEGLDKPKPTDGIRTFAAKKAIALLQWVEQKNEKSKKPGNRTKHKPAA